MNNAIKTLTLLVVATLSGCTVNNAIVQKAAGLDDQVIAFKNEQQARIDKFNQDYREQSNQLLSQLESLADQHLSFGRDQDAQAIADDLTSKLDPAALPKTFSDRLFSDVVAEREQLRKVDAQIQKARDDYADNYAQLKLTLNKLDELHKQLQTLKKKDNAADVAGNIVAGVQAAYEGFKAGQKEVAAQEQSTADQPATH